MADRLPLGAGRQVQDDLSQILDPAAAIDRLDQPDDGMVALAAGTDGTDGPTDAAGGIVDGQTAGRARALGLDPRARLDDNDANPLLAAVGDLLVTGPTNTNLLDLYLLLVEPRGS